MIDPVFTGSFFLEWLRLFKNLRAKFDGRTELPIEIQDICDALIDMGYQDDIRVVAEVMDLTQLLGTYVQWVERDAVYGEPKLVSLIVYPENADPLTQRIVCAKELVHVCDANAAKSHDPVGIMELARVLSDRIGLNEKMQIAKLKVAKDILAQGQALMLLFPKAARIICRQRIAENRMSVAEVQELLQLPLSTVEEMLEEEWEEIADSLADF
jgi:hypothetical protein